MSKQGKGFNSKPNETSRDVMNLEMLFRAQSTYGEAMVATSDKAANEQFVQYSARFGRVGDVRLLGRFAVPYDYDPAFWWDREKRYSLMARSVNTALTRENREIIDLFQTPSKDLLYRIFGREITAVHKAGENTDMTAGRIISRLEAEIFYACRDFEYVYRTIRMWQSLIGHGFSKVLTAHANYNKISNAVATLKGFPWPSDVTKKVRAHLAVTARQMGTVKDGYDFAFLRVPVPTYGAFDDNLTPTAPSSANKGTLKFYSVPAQSEAAHLYGIKTPASVGLNNAYSALSADFDVKRKACAVDADFTQYATSLLNHLEACIKRIVTLWGRGRLGETYNSANAWFSAENTSNVVEFLTKQSFSMMDGIFDPDAIADEVAADLIEPKDDVDFVAKRMTYFGKQQAVRNILVHHHEELFSEKDHVSEFWPDSGRLQFGDEYEFTSANASDWATLNVSDIATRLLQYYKSLAVDVNTLTDQVHPGVYSGDIAYSPTTFFLARNGGGSNVADVPEVAAMGLHFGLIKGKTDGNFADDCTTFAPNASGHELKTMILDKLKTIQTVRVNDTIPNATFAALHAYSNETFTFPGPQAFCNTQLDLEDVPGFGEWQMLALSQGGIPIYTFGVEDCIEKWGQDTNPERVFISARDVDSIRPVYAKNISEFGDLSAVAEGDADDHLLQRLRPWMPRTFLHMDNPLYDPFYCMDFEIVSSQPIETWVVDKTGKAAANALPGFFLDYTNVQNPEWDDINISYRGNSAAGSRGTDTISHMDDVAWMGGSANRVIIPEPWFFARNMDVYTGSWLDWTNAWFSKSGEAAPVKDTLTMQKTLVANVYIHQIPKWVNVRPLQSFTSYTVPASQDAISQLRTAMVYSLASAMSIMYPDVGRRKGWQGINRHAGIGANRVAFENMLAGFVTEPKSIPTPAYATGSGPMPTSVQQFVNFNLAKAASNRMTRKGAPMRQKIYNNPPPIKKDKPSFDKFEDKPDLQQKVDTAAPVKPDGGGSGSV